MVQHMLPVLRRLFCETTDAELCLCDLAVDVEAYAEDASALQRSLEGTWPGKWVLYKH